jgi:hypothetical protein
MMSLVAHTLDAQRKCGQCNAPLTAGPAWKATLILFALIIAGCGDGREAARRTYCKNNLFMLHSALVGYVAKYHDVPRDEDGRPSLEPFKDPELCRELGIEALMLECPSCKDEKHASYILNPALTADDLGSDSKVIIACDQRPHHRVISRYGKHHPIANVLLGNKLRVSMDLPPKEQEEWRRLFVEGDERAGRISLREGADKSWGSGDVLWYVGPGKGYVPNEYQRDPP